MNMGSEKNRPKVGLGVLIFNQHNQLLMGKRITSHGSGDICPVGGHLEYGESFLDCAKRESLEEVGFIPDDITYLTTTNDVFPEKLHYVTIFMAAKLPASTIVKNMEPHKVESWEWFDINNLPDNLFLTVKTFLKNHDIEEVCLKHNASV